MKKFIDSIEIKTMPENIFQWFMNIDRNYQSWHSDHVSFEWIKGKPWEVGSIAIAKEYIHGELHTLKSRTFKSKKNKIIEFKNYFPISMFLPKGSFKFTSTDSGCIFTATLSFRFGSLLSRLFKKRMECSFEHMKQEGKNLKRLLEHEDK